MLALICYAVGVRLFKGFQLLGSVCRFGNAIKDRKRRVPAVQSADSANETIVELLIVLIAVLLALYGLMVGSTCGVS